MMEGIKVVGRLLLRTESLNSFEALEFMLNVNVPFGVTKATTKPAGNSTALG